MSWTDTPAGMWAQAWQELGRGVADRKHPARTPTLATTGPDGPEARTVVLRGIDPDRATLEIHTDTASAKVAQIAQDPRVALHIWIPKQNLQLRLAAHAVLIHSDANRWAKIPPNAQIVYGGTPAPGATLARPEDHAPGATQDRFTTIECSLTRADILHLGTPRHLRAAFLGPDWAGTWIAP